MKDRYDEINTLAKYRAGEFVKQAYNLGNREALRNLESRVSIDLVAMQHGFRLYVRLDGKQIKNRDFDLQHLLNLFHDDSRKFDVKKILRAVDQTIFDLQWLKHKFEKENEK